MLSQAQLLTLIGVLFALLVSVGAFTIKYVIDGLRERIRDLEEFVSQINSAVIESRLNEADSRIEGIWNQIGRSSKEGMRETVHKSANALSVLVQEFPDHARRLERLERRVYNGHRNDER